MHVVDKIYQKVLNHLAGKPNQTIGLTELAIELNLNVDLLKNNPKVMKLIELHQPGVQSMLDWTVREWITYYNQYIHQGFKYHPELQQTWFGVPMLKNPLDAWVQQEIITKTKPDVIIELGVKFGGSVLYYAHLLDLLGNDGRVIGIDISLTQVKSISHPNIELIESSSTEPSLVEDITKLLHNKTVMVVADSNHEASHVLKELELYSKFIQPGYYYVVEDGMADFLRLHPVPMDGAYVAIQQFIRENEAFEIDDCFGERYVLTHNPSGYLRRIKP